MHHLPTIHPPVDVDTITGVTLEVEVLAGDDRDGLGTCAHEEARSSRHDSVLACYGPVALFKPMACCLFFGSNCP